MLDIFTLQTGYIFCYGVVSLLGFIFRFYAGFFTARLLSFHIYASVCVWVWVCRFEGVGF